MKQVWSEQGKRGVWLKVPRELSQLIPVAVEPGFTFHHAEQVQLRSVRNVVPLTWELAQQQTAQENVCWIQQRPAVPVSMQCYHSFGPYGLSRLGVYTQYTRMTFLLVEGRHTAQVAGNP